MLSHHCPFTLSVLLQQFQGAQRVTHLGMGPNDEDWSVKVTILSCDMEVSPAIGHMCHIWELR